MHSGSTSVSFGELLDDAFVARYTDFSGRAAMNAALKAASLAVRAGGDPVAEEAHAFLVRHSSFDNWEELMGQATSRYMRRKLRF